MYEKLRSLFIAVAVGVLVNLALERHLADYDAGSGWCAGAIVGVGLWVVLVAYGEIRRQRRRGMITLAGARR